MKNVTNKQKKEFLEKNIERINTVLSAKIGINTQLKILAGKNYRREIFYSLVDNRNLKDNCGIMTCAFKELHIDSSIYWNESEVTFVFDFQYEHIPFGRNGCEFCRIWITDKDDILHLA